MIDDSETVILKKAANYFVPANEAIIPDIGQYFSFETFNGIAAQKALSDYVKKNGLWIGGTIFLTSSALFFKANSLNAQLNRGNKLADLILLEDILAVHFQKALGSSIITAVSEKNSMSFRCFGAKKVLLKISEYTNHARIIGN